MSLPVSRVCPAGLPPARPWTTNEGLEHWAVMLDMGFITKGIHHDSMVRTAPFEGKVER